MASVAIVLKTTKKLTNDEYAVSLRVIHERVSKYYVLNSLISDPTLKFRARQEDWRAPQPEDNGLGKFMKTVSDYRKLNDILSQRLLAARNLLKEYAEDRIVFSFERFEEDIRNIESRRTIKNKKSILLKDYYLSIIQEHEQNQKIGLASIFSSTLSSIEEFRPSLLLADVNVKFLEAFEAWLRSVKKNKDTSISVKIRNIQRALNLAIADKLFKADDYPFGEKKYSVNKRLNSKTRKRSIPLDVISKIRDLQLEESSSIHLAQQIFMFSFYTRGMNFVDIAALKWSDIVNDEIHYVRRKTGQLFEIPLNEHVKSILEYYKSANKNASGYIFPIYNNAVHKTEKQKYTRKKTAIKKINDKLKEIAKMIGEEGLKLTTYVSRHSYATNLKRAGVPTSYISEALGHQTEEQTQTYLAEFEKGVISNLESKIFNF